MNIKHYLMLAIGYFVGRHYGRQQGTNSRAPYVRPPGNRASMSGTISSIVREIVIRKINKVVYGDESIRRSTYTTTPRRTQHRDYRPPAQRGGVVLETDPELEKLLDEEERIARERDESHSGNYGPNGI